MDWPKNGVVKSKKKADFWRFAGVAGGKRAISLRNIGAFLGEWRYNPAAGRCHNVLWHTVDNISVC